MRVQFLEETYDFVDSLTVDEAIVMWDNAQVGVHELMAHLVRGNPHAIACLVFILKRRNKEAVKLDDLKSVHVNGIRFLPDEDEEPAEGDGGEPMPDPTVKTSRTGRGRTKGTSTT